jgi:hypothetical protein
MQFTPEIPPLIFDWSPMQNKERRANTGRSGALAAEDRSSGSDCIGALLRLGVNASRRMLLLSKALPLRDHARAKFPT